MAIPTTVPTLLGSSRWNLPEEIGLCEIDQLVAEGFILMGGPLVDEDGAMLIVNADDENEVREKLKNDPWMKHGVLKLESVKRWQIFIDVRK